ncbi:hypothetical protein AADG42_01370 [Ammonicoccus fulvus]|uniref:HTH tetR-type domain-containing protein n=1 Tax=Ammonicoccus fulvus TaxID=3138240 RepID=A0ABZ3FKV3_9ACTN
MSAAIVVAARQGLHGLTHRNVEMMAGVPRGSASNHFPTRESLLVALATHCRERQLQDVGSAITASAPNAAQHERSLDIIARTLDRALADPDPHLALMELRIEATRNPVVAEALAVNAALTAGSLGDTMPAATVGATTPDVRAIELFQAGWAGTVYAMLTNPGAAERTIDTRTWAAALLAAVGAAS